MFVEKSETKNRINPTGTAVNLPGILRHQFPQRLKKLYFFNSFLILVLILLFLIFPLMRHKPSWWKSQWGWEQDKWWWPAAIVIQKARERERSGPRHRLMNGHGHDPQIQTGTRKKTDIQILVSDGRNCWCSIHHQKLRINNARLTINTYTTTTVQQSNPRRLYISVFYLFYLLLLFSLPSYFLNELSWTNKENHCSIAIVYPSSNGPTTVALEKF